MHWPKWTFARVTALALVLVVATVGILFYLHGREPSYQGRPYHLYMMEYQSRDQATHLRARDAINAVGAAALPFLIKTASPGPTDPKVRAAALKALGVLGGKAQPCVAMVIQATDDETADVRIAAMYALGRIPANAAIVTPLYVRKMSDHHPTIRMRAAENLGHVSVRPESAIPLLIKACGDSSSGVRAAARNTLEILGITPPPPTSKKAAIPEPPPPE